MKIQELFKKNGKWDALPEDQKSFLRTVDEALTEAAFSDDHKSKLEDLVKKASENETATTEMRDAIKAHAELIAQMKDAGYSPVQANDPYEAIGKTLRSEDNLKALKSARNRDAGANKETVLAFNIKAADVMLRSTNITGSNLPAPMIVPGINEAPRNEPFILDLVDVGAATSPTIYWINKTGRQDGTAMIAEGALKPLSDFDLATETTTVRKIASRTQVSTEMLEDVDFIEGEIRSEGIMSNRLAIENQILFGDGTGQNLTGITTYASAFAAGDLADTVEKANIADALLAGITQLQMLNYNATGIVTSPVQRFKMRTLKDANGQPIIPVASNSSATVVDGITVMAKNQIPAGKVLIGDFKRSKVKILTDLRVEMGYSTGDWENNRVSFRVESRLAHYISDVDTAAFIYDDVDVIKAAIEAAPTV